MRSHFLLSPGVATACAVAGAATLLSGNCSAQNHLTAADYATNSIYNGGWSAGQNGGYGFGPWSFDRTDATPEGQYQGMSASSALGRSWTLLTYDNHTGLANAGRAIPGGLQPGQTLELVVQNPLGYHFFRGFDILCLNGTNNDAGGNNTAALRAQVFAYGATDWRVVDDSGSTHTLLDVSTAGSAGMKFDLALTSTNTYSVTLTPLSDPSSAYTNAGTLSTNLPINWVNFRLWWGTSSGLTDTENNFEISSMTIQGLALNIQRDGSNVILSWPGIFAKFDLTSCTNLGAPVWNPVSPLPSFVDGQNVVTNSIAGAQQFYRLQLPQ